MEPDFEFEFEPLDLQSAVYQALGAASVCWENLDSAGIFQSDRAVLIGEALIQRIKELARDGKIV